MTISPDDPRHGQHYIYQHYGCRCDPCRAAGASYNKKAREKRKNVVLEPDDPRHGTHGAYSNYRCRCTPCREANSKYKLDHPSKYSYESHRKRHLKKWFNMSPEDYHTLLDDQGGGCAVCGKTEEQNGKALSVDHDRACCPSLQSCGKCVRGILCTTCNKAIGHLGDTSTSVQLAVDYLVRYETRVHA